jgi:hypothetical protein
MYQFMLPRASFEGDVNLKVINLYLCATQSACMSCHVKLIYIYIYIYIYLYVCMYIHTYIKKIVLAC